MNELIEITHKINKKKKLCKIFAKFLKKMRENKKILKQNLQGE